MSFASAYAGRRVLLTGHTGFKGSWLASWLLDEGAIVGGVALAPTAGLFGALDLATELEAHHLVDVRDASAVKEIVRDFAPAIVFHLAAQPLVKEGYRDPSGTWTTNVTGTLNLLEAVRETPSVKACVVVTTDKVYRDRPRPGGYQEDDRLGGVDPYSASKAAVELLVASHRASFFSASGSPALVTVRAGNVLGGGDEAPDRLVPDFFRSGRAGEPLVLRYPGAIRPWQHVLEPLSGYLELGRRLLSGGTPSTAFNFGPAEDALFTVRDVAEKLVALTGTGRIEVDAGTPQHETARLQLDPARAHAELGWKPVWGTDRALAETVSWRRRVGAGEPARTVTREQIAAYVNGARAMDLAWTKDGAS